MIEIQWADSIDEYDDDGNPLPLPCGFKHCCHSECDLFDEWDFVCRAGLASDTDFIILLPGPECPGPGKYKLARVE